MRELKLQGGTNRSTREPQLTDTLAKYPFRMQFVGEKGVDLGGVCRDAYTAFFNSAYQKFFDGSTLVTPAIHPGTDIAALKNLGCIISHSYLISGILPVRVAFPCLAHVLLPRDGLIMKFMCRPSLIV